MGIFSSIADRDVGDGGVWLAIWGSGGRGASELKDRDKESASASFATDTVGVMTWMTPGGSLGAWGRGQDVPSNLLVRVRNISDAHSPSFPQNFHTALWRSRVGIGEWGSRTGRL